MTQEAPNPGWVVPDYLPVLAWGAHPPGSPEFCAMEAASWLAGEPWSDHPRCVHPVIADVARWVNDTVDDATRQTLWPLIVASLNTAIGRRPLFGWRLRTAAARAKRRAAHHGDPISAWRSVLDAYASLSAPRPGGTDTPLGGPVGACRIAPRP
ncbi:MAG TPA: hypothetical protein VFP54_06885 [Acidimicrobiales bacterium]|nr:hypothetical protein [Acidimicrobiales bacterium]